MQDLQDHLLQMRQSLCREIDIGGLFSRNAVVHKWKAPWRLLLLREAAAWRLCELVQQSLDLSRSSSILGARVLLRASFETLAILIYSSQSMRSVVARTTDFHAFSTKTTRLLLGSRDKSTQVESINILTVLGSAEKRYPGLEAWYASLSESSHPNCEGMLRGYSVSRAEDYVTRFESRWSSLFGADHESALAACLGIFDVEYNHEWIGAFDDLERWIEANDQALEASKPRDA